MGEVNRLSSISMSVTSSVRQEDFHVCQGLHKFNPERTRVPEFMPKLGNVHP